MLKMEQAKSLRINDRGELEIETDLGTVQFSKPVAYQERNGKRKTVEVAYLLNGDNYGFKVNEYDTSFPLIIDPVLSWNTFMGTVNDDTCNSIAVDDAGDIYVAGYSQATWGSPVDDFSGNLDGFAAKLDSSGGLVWNTFMGSSNADNSTSIAVDSAGNVYVAGTSFAGWGGTATVNAFAGFEDAFAAKLDSSGGLLWNTFMGSSSQDDGNSIAVDSAGNVYVAGDSFATWGSPIRSFTDGAGNGFAAKLNSSGGLVWNTFMGSGYTNTTIGKSIAVDSSRNVYVAGESMASWGSPESPFGQVGYKDGFAAKLDSGGGLVWNTFMGGTNEDSAASIAVDSAGNVYVAGLDVGLDPAGFATKLDSSGGQLWYTTLGAYPDGDTITSISIDGAGNVYVAGYSEATWGSPIYPHSADIDGFAAKLNNSGTLVWNTFLGGGGDDRGGSIVVDGSGNVYVAGNSDAAWGGTATVNPFAGNGDAFVAKLSPLVWYVTSTGAGSMDGTGWDDAFFSIQDAIDAASAGDEIWVAGGTYSPSDASGITVDKTVLIFGGFNGTETAKNDRDWKTNVTTVDGGNVQSCFNVSADATIDGFTISNGNAVLSLGGGMSIYGAVMPTISNCTFTGNTAQNGGGVAVGPNSIPTIINCLFTGNTATNLGGGIYNLQSTVTIINCVFSQNQTSSDGGGGIANVNSITTITNCTFRVNIAGSVGAGNEIHNLSSSSTITNCILWDYLTGNPEIYDDPGSTSTVNYCDIEGGWTGGTGNINSDPLFGAPGDYHLQAGSACIDAGDNSAVPMGVTADIDGEPRFSDDLSAADTGNGTPPIVDMGAVEYLDSDDDGMPDWWEKAHGLDPYYPDDYALDPDNDGLSNLEEYQYNTAPDNDDTDGDGLSDGYEVSIGTDPLTPNQPNQVITVFTSQPIHKFGCERLGSLTFRFAEGSILEAGNGWTITLPTG